MVASAPLRAHTHLTFTQRALDTLKPRARGFVEYYDTKSPGLALRVQPTGKKTFYLNYRLPNQRRCPTGPRPAPGRDTRTSRLTHRNTTVDGPVSRRGNLLFDPQNGTHDSPKRHFADL